MTDLTVVVLASTAAVLVLITCLNRRLDRLGRAVARMARIGQP